jgi:hypothetical protein
MGSKVDALKNLKDFFLFKESSDNVITQGNFDNNWNLPPDAVNAMKVTGVITVK